MRDAVALRDKYTCQICERVTESGDCDHIIPEARGGKTETLGILLGSVATPCGIGVFCS